jgi:ribosome biogenesis GTPase
MKGRVIKSMGSSYHVISDDGARVECRIAGKYRLEGLRSTNPVVVGDLVEYELAAGETMGRIQEVLPRRNYIIRKSAKLSKAHQIIASNIDRLLLMVTISHPVTYPEFIDRYLVSSEAYNIPSELLINKTDLYDREELDTMAEWTRIYESIGYKVYACSLKDGVLPQGLKNSFNKGVTLIGGISGVGKTSLINAVDPGLKLRIREISDVHGSGKHTTTFAEMFELEGGGFLIDTPGIRGFGMTDMEDEPLFHYFPEIFRISAGCKFHNCIHVSEPDCAVIQAVEIGKVSLSRYRSYLGLLEEQQNASKYR